MLKGTDIAEVGEARILYCTELGERDMNRTLVLCNGA